MEALTPQIAQRIGVWAEYYRKEKAILWLGKEMPTWSKRCHLKVKVTYGHCDGTTTFTFDRGRLVSLDMQIEGTLDQIVSKMLPREMMYTVFAHRLGKSMPRWAEEGCSTLHKDDKEWARYGRIARETLDTLGEPVPLNRLFTMKQFRRDGMVLCAQSYSVTAFLLTAKNRNTFLAFVKQGQKDGWDKAVKAHYEYASVDELETAWLASLKKAKK